MVGEGLIDQKEAVARVDPASLEQLERARVAEKRAPKPIAVGVAASPGAACGKAVFDADRAVEWSKTGQQVLLIRSETTPEDIHGMAVAQGILTSRGGKTSHAAVVARGMGKPAVTAVAELAVDADARVAHIDGTDIKEGELISIDGTTGRVFRGAVPLMDPQPTPDLEILLGWADQVRKLGVRANADLPDDARRARAAGAEGIGLARTEHMFLGERLDIVQRVILSTDPKMSEAALEELRSLQVTDFEALLEAMDGLPVIIRLLDPPLHEFLPSRLELEREMGKKRDLGQPVADLQQMSTQVARWEEENPMLGLRGVRLGLIVADLYRMQTRAALEALVRRLEAGGEPHLEIMIPLVAAAEELRLMRVMIEEEIAAFSARSGHTLRVPIGTMIELPRAALTAAEIARHADFFSFGTNDLTQMTYGLSRDDAEGLFLQDYLERNILTSDPFQTLDRHGVGRLMGFAVSEGRMANPDLTVGLCGEHGGDPASIAFCREMGLDYVSCSPPRVKVARLAAAQAEFGLDIGSTI
jgi:pyruvate,orthophosphate dikinase